MSQINTSAWLNDVAYTKASRRSSVFFDHVFVYQHPSQNIISDSNMRHNIDHTQKQMANV